MGCNCKWFEVIVAIVIFVVGVWPDFLGMMVSKWIIGIAAVVLLIHAFKCGHCNTMVGGGDMMKSQKMPVVAQKKAKKRK